MLRPKDIIDQLGISAPTLRVWSNTFAPVLSPGAQPSKTETGGAAQRRYTEEDLAYFRQAKALLDSGKTFDEALANLRSEPLPESTEPLIAHQNPPNDVAVVEQIHPIIRAFEEALAAKEQAIQAKDELIAELRLQLDRRPTSQPTIQPPQFRWGFLNRLLTEGAQDVG